MADDKRDNYLETGIKAAKEILDAVPVYQDAIQPSAKTIGEGLSGVLRMAMLPLKMIGYKADQWEKMFKDSLERKTANIPSEKLIPPNPTVTGPILQSLAYTAHEDSLREMFTSLLATAMNSDTASKAHPAFVEIIKQLVPDEAKILEFLVDKEVTIHSAMYVSVPSPAIPSPQGYNRSFLIEDVVLGRSDLAGSYSTNLTRLGLVTITDFPLSYSDALDSRLEEKSYRHNEILYNLRSVNLLQVTPFGEQFIQACVKRVE